METIRFDDIERLRSKVSQEFSSWSKPIEVTQEKINEFADVNGDHQWIHIDVECARRESLFKAPVAHGFLTLSLTLNSNSTSCCARISRACKESRSTITDAITLGH